MQFLQIVVLVHINSLDSITTGEDDGTILILRFSLSKIQGTMQLYPVYFHFLLQLVIILHKNGIILLPIPPCGISWFASLNQVRYSLSVNDFRCFFFLYGMNLLCNGVVIFLFSFSVLLLPLSSQPNFAFLICFHSSQTGTLSLSEWF